MSDLQPHYRKLVARGERREKRRVRRKARRHTWARNSYEAKSLGRKG